MLNICVSGATGWTGRELVGAIFGQAGEHLVLRHEGALTAKPFVFGSLLAARRLGEITGVVRGLDKLLFGEA